MENFREQLIVDWSDLSNGYYSHLPKVSVSDLNDVLLWLESFGIPEEEGFWTAKGTDPIKNETKYLPTEVRWTKDGKEDLFLDAALVYNFPHVSRVELLNYFGLPGADKIVMYEKPRPTIAFVRSNPIGAYWPEQGKNAYRSASGDSYPYGTTVVVNGASYIKERRQVAFYGFPVWIRVANGYEF